MPRLPITPATETAMGEPAFGEMKPRRLVPEMRESVKAKIEQPTSFIEPKVTNPAVNPEFVEEGHQKEQAGDSVTRFFSQIDSLPQPRMAKPMPVPPYAADAQPLTDQAHPLTQLYDRFVMREGLQKLLEHEPDELANEGPINHVLHAIGGFFDYFDVSQPATKNSSVAHVLLDMLTGAGSPNQTTPGSSWEEAVPHAIAGVFNELANSRNEYRKRLKELDAVGATAFQRRDDPELGAAYDKFWDAALDLGFGVEAPIRQAFVSASSKAGRVAVKGLKVEQVARPLGSRKTALPQFGLGDVAVGANESTLRGMRMQDMRTKAGDGTLQGVEDLNRAQRYVWTKSSKGRYEDVERLHNITNGRRFEIKPDDYLGEPTPLRGAAGSNYPHGGAGSDQLFMNSAQHTMRVRAQLMRSPAAMLPPEAPPKLESFNPEPQHTPYAYTGLQRRWTREGSEYRRRLASLYRPPPGAGGEEP